MEDFLKFRKMITPIIIQILFWIGVVLCVIVGIGEIVAGIDRPADSGGGSCSEVCSRCLLGRCWSASTAKSSSCCSASTTR